MSLHIGRYLLPVLLLAGVSSRAGDTFSVTVTPVESHQATLVEIPLPDGVDANTRWEIVDSTGQPLLTQPVLGESHCLILKSTAQQPTKYTLRAANAPASETKLQANEKDGQLHLLDSPHQILSYHTQPSQPPAGIASHYSRSGHIHPLMVPFDRPITAEYPIDHPHQNGVFFAWVNTTFDKHEVDFWNLGKQLGSVRNKRLIALQAGPLYAGFTAELEHVDLTTGGAVVLNETWNVMAFSMKDGDQRDYYLVDFESQQKAATDRPLTINEYHYGGFGWRGSTDWLLNRKDVNQQGCEFLTSEGLDRLKGNHTRPDWVAVTGLIQGEPCTIAIFGHPSNFRHPQPVRLHPNKPYFCFAPCVIGEFEISEKKPLTSKYRVVTHTGPADPALYSRLAKDWAQLPHIVVE